MGVYQPGVRHGWPGNWDNLMGDRPHLTLDSTYIVFDGVTNRNRDSFLIKSYK